MVDLPTGFRVVQPGQQQPQTPQVPQGFRVVQPAAPQSNAPTINVGGRTLSIEGYRALPDEEREALRALIAQNNPSATMEPQPPAPAQQGGDEWRRGVLAPIEKNTATGAFRPAVPQLAMDAWNAVTLPGDVAAGNVPDLMPGQSFANLSDETTGRALDLSGIAAVGAPVGPRGTFSAATGQRIPPRVTQALERDGIAPNQVSQRVAEMGPGAVVADIGPSMQNLAMGAAARPSAGQSQFFDLLRGRASSARPRIQSQVNDILGPSVSRGEQYDRVQELKSATSPLYRSVFSQASPVDTTAMVRTIDDMMPNYAGSQTLLRRVRGWLTDDDIPTSNPQRLFSVRNDLDDLLDDPNLGRVRETVKSLRDMVDAELANKVPGIKDADAQWQELSRQASSFDVGRSLFGQGKEATDPRDMLRDLIAGVQPEGALTGPSGSSFAMSQGMRNELDRLIGTGTANRTRLAQAIRGDGSWNREKLAQVYGDERADAIIRLFDNEATMYETENMVRGGSITGLRQAANEAVNGPAMPSAPIFEGPLGVNVGNMLRRGAQKVTGGLSDRISENRNRDIIEAIMGTGGWYENRTSPGTLSLLRALIVGGTPNNGGTTAPGTAGPQSR